jgi:hypothetical protein
MSSQAGVFAMAIVVFGVAFGASAQDARIPYAILYKIQITQKKLEQTHTNLLISVRLQSQSTNVVATNLTAFIEDGTNRSPVKLREHGEFSVPLRDDWLTNDAWLVVNQPKGTMTLNWTIGFDPGAMSNRLRYSELMKQVLEIEPIQAEMSRAFPRAPRLVPSGLVLYFPPKEESKVIILKKDGEQTLKPNARGLIVVPLNPAFMKENPEVWMPVLPGRLNVEFQEIKD